MAAPLTDFMYGILRADLHQLLFKKVTVLTAVKATISYGFHEVSYFLPVSCFPVIFTHPES